jgi:hypothetical protein
MLPDVTLPHHRGGSVTNPANLGSKLAPFLHLCSYITLVVDSNWPVAFVVAMVG